MKGKKALSLLLAMLMLAGLMTVGAYAASGEPSGEALAFAADAKALAGEWTLDAEKGVWSLMGVRYCEKPNAPQLQQLNIFVPAAYMDEAGQLTEKVVNGYNAATAPILYINSVGGYAQSAPSGVSRYLDYIAQGYVVVSPGCRGKQTTDDSGKFIGKSPAGLVDLKAGIRWLKANDAQLPGSSERIVSMGTSAGGAMSALLATTGNVKDYEPYLEEIGAVMDSTDDIYAAQCYCPITDLDNADAAYEWFYNSDINYAFMIFSGELTDFQQALSMDLAEYYVDYVNELKLKDAEGNKLKLTGLREGSYYDYMLSVIGKSLADYLVETCSVEVKGMSPYTYVNEDAAKAIVAELNGEDEWLSLDFTYSTATTGPSTVVTYASGAVCGVRSIEDFVANFRSRGKMCPSFDNLDRGEAENQVFGSEGEDYLHFNTTIAELLEDNDYSKYPGYDEAYAEAYAEAAEGEERVRLLNPMNFIGEGDTAPFVRIRTGSSDEHTSFTVGMNLALAIETKTDSQVDYALAWGQGHGEAEINKQDLIDWIERVCKYEAPLSQENIESLLDLDNMDYTWTLSGEGEKAYYLLDPVVDVAKPEMAAYQGISVAIPAYYVKGQNADGNLEFDYDYEFVNPNGVTYTAETAPIILNTGAMGYSAGTTGKAGGGYVPYGYINVAMGNRGKSLATVDARGELYYCGDAPHCLVDQKASVRWLKYNIALGNLCGDAERMISTGGSGGGAHSLMLAATGNHSDFYPYLEEAGALMYYTDANGKKVEISDGIWACCPYSPIANLEEGNMAYEFEGGLAKDDALLKKYSEFRQILSNAEAEQYMHYVNEDLRLTWDLDGDGRREALTIEYDEKTDTWSGSYIELMERFAEEQLEWYLNNLPENEQEWRYAYEGQSNAEAYLKGDYKGSGEMSGEMSGEPSGESDAESIANNEGYASEADSGTKAGTGNDLTEWVRYSVDENGQYDVDFDFADFMVFRGRGKTNPAFDDLDLGQAENQVFGDFDQDFKHWDVYVLNAMDEAYDELEKAYDGDSKHESFEELYEAYKSDVETTLDGDKFGNNIVHLYNPVNYILDPETDQPAWVHICHGTHDSDCSVFVTMNDGVAWDMMGVDSFFAWSWGDGHVAGDPVGTTMVGYIDAMVEAGK